MDGHAAAIEGAGHLRKALSPRRQGRLSRRPAARDGLSAQRVRTLSRVPAAGKTARPNRGKGADSRVYLLMRAMILGAGRGERMRPLTDARPKPLLDVGGKPLIVWQIERLVAAGFDELVINVSHLSAVIEDRKSTRLNSSHLGI